jgi:hypothetical protein
MMDKEVKILAFELTCALNRLQCLQDDMRIIQEKLFTCGSVTQKSVLKRKVFYVSDGVDCAEPSDEEPTL